MDKGLLAHLLFDESTTSKIQEDQLLLLLIKSNVLRLNV